MKINIEIVQEAIQAFDDRYLDEGMEELKILDLPMDTYYIEYSEEGISKNDFKYAKLQIYMVTNFINKHERLQFLLEYVKVEFFYLDLKGVLKPNNLDTIWFGLLKLDKIEEVTAKNLKLIRFNNLTSEVLWLNSNKGDFFIMLDNITSDSGPEVVENFEMLNLKLKEKSKSIGIIY